jgi:hypothetical protein
MAKRWSTGPVGAGGLEQVGDEAGGYRLAAAALLVLPGIRVERGNDRDALRGGALQRVDHDQLLHEPLIDGRRVRLDDEYVGAANAVVITDVQLAVGEGAGIRGQEMGAQFGGDILGKLRMRPPRRNQESLAAAGRDLRHLVSGLVSCGLERRIGRLIRD